MRPCVGSLYNLISLYITQISHLSSRILPGRSGTSYVSRVWLWMYCLTARILDRWNATYRHLKLLWPENSLITSRFAKLMVNTSGLLHIAWPTWVPALCHALHLPRNANYEYQLNRSVWKRMAYCGDGEIWKRSRWKKNGMEKKQNKDEGVEISMKANAIEKDSNTALREQ